MKVIKVIKLKIISGKATPAPPIGPQLGSIGVNTMSFCNKFNNFTKNINNVILPVLIFVYEDKSFDFKIKKISVVDQLFKKLNIKKGSKTPNINKIGKIKKKDILEIAKYKMSDLNCYNNINSAVSMIIGTAKSCGIDIE